MEKEEAFGKIIHYLQATANTFYSPMGNKKEVKMWNLLLSTRDKLEKEFNKDIK